MLTTLCYNVQEVLGINTQCSNDKKKGDEAAAGDN